MHRDCPGQSPDSPTLTAHSHGRAWFARYKEGSRAIGPSIPDSCKFPDNSRFSWPVIISKSNKKYKAWIERTEMTVTRQTSTRFIVSLSAGTGSDGSEPWKLHSSGFLPMNTFSTPCHTTHQQTRRSPTLHVRNNITHTHAHLTALCPRLHGWVGTRKVKPIWVLLKQETASGSDISWAVCRSAPRSRQITTPARHNSVFYRPDALPDAQPTVSKHWRHQQEQYQHTLYRLPSGVAA